MIKRIVVFIGALVGATITSVALMAAPAAASVPLGNCCQLHEYLLTDTNGQMYTLGAISPGNPGGTNNVEACVQVQAQNGGWVDKSDTCVLTNGTSATSRDFAPVSGHTYRAEVFGYHNGFIATAYGAPHTA